MRQLDFHPAGDCFGRPLRPAMERAARIFLHSFDAAAFDDALFSRHAIHLPADISRSVMRRRAEYFYGRHCARQALAALGHPPAQVLSGASREPLWPSAVRGSITHSDNMAAAVVVPAQQCRGIGVDISAPVGEAMQQAVLGMVLCEREFRLLQALPPRFGIGHYLALVFSAKESLFKALFADVRAYLEFNLMEVREVSLEHSLALFEVVAPVCAHFPVGSYCAVQFTFLEDGSVVTLFSWR
jgi:enterobactin synthetase component D